MTVVAEGVETDEQLGHLRRLGCTRAQGYLFSHPRPAEETNQFLGQFLTTAPAHIVIGEGPSLA